MAKKVFGDYYLGLDVGTDSIGWAVTDPQYEVLRFNSKAMWGIHLFKEGQSASARRLQRTARRRLERRNRRIRYLRDFFGPEIAKIDPGFFQRLDESMLFVEDRSVKQKYSLFNDPKFNDKTYHKQFPTIYHLRSYLMNTDDMPDIRLVYLALAHIVKHRGHFLYEGLSDEAVPEFKEVFVRLQEQLCDIGIIQGILNESVSEIGDVIRSQESITAKKEKLSKLIPVNEDNATASKELVSALSGGKFSVVKLFGEGYEEAVKDSEFSKTINISNPIIDDSADFLEDVFGPDRADILALLRSVYNWSALSSILGEEKFISEAKKNQYQQHRSDLALLKTILKGIGDADLAKSVLNSPTEDSYARYVRHKSVKNTKHISQADFCKHLRKMITDEKTGVWDKVVGLGIKSDLLSDMKSRIGNDSFMPLQYSSSNSVLPNAVHLAEAKRIVANMARFYPFLKEEKDGITVGDKIISLVNFRVPYFVGPLGGNTTSGVAGWAVRKAEGAVTPWNWESMVDKDETSEKFIENLTTYCSFLYKEKVLPKNSIAFCRYKLYNELNTMTVNGARIDPDTKMQLVRELFEGRAANINKKTISDFLKSRMGIEGVVEGIDDKIKSNLSSENRLKEILGDEYNRKLAEEIIKTVTIFGDDRCRLREKLEKDYSGKLSKDVISKLERLKFKDWGSLSERLLLGVRSMVDGQEMCILSAMESTSMNLMELLSDKYGFKKKIEAINKEEAGDLAESDILDSMRASPAVRHAVGRVFSVIDDILKVTGHPPAKVFVETTREHRDSKRTVSRKEALIARYNNLTKNDDAKELLASLEGTDEPRLRGKKLYAYYCQMGRCMYCGRPVDLSGLDNKDQYDMDHIYPRSQIKDDSADNMVLTCRTCNDSKKDVYPIEEAVQIKMGGFWSTLKSSGFISEEKYGRLTRKSPLTGDEKAGFINRQLVETGQSVSAVTQMLELKFGKASDVIYVKGGNVSEFRQIQTNARKGADGKYEVSKPFYIKCRNVNDHHHAKDAYLNIVVGNVYDVKFTKNRQTIPQGDYNLRRMYDFPISFGDTVAWTPGTDGSIAVVDKWMRRDNILYTRAPYVGTGQLFDLNVTKRSGNSDEESSNERRIPIKKGMDIAKYGGYNSIRTSYFALFEHDSGKGAIRSLIPIPVLVGRDVDEEILVRHAIKLGLVSPRMILPCVKLDATLQKDGLRLTLKGINDKNTLTVVPATQLVVNYDHLRVFKGVFKYVDKENVRGKSHIYSAADNGVSEEAAVAAFDHLVEKISSGYISSAITDKAIRALTGSKDTFLKLELDKKAEVLAQLLKALHCSPEVGSLDLIGGGKIGRMVPSLKISSWDEALLINQSPSGLFENIVNLKKI